VLASILDEHLSVSKDGLDPLLDRSHNVPIPCMTHTPATAIGQPAGG